jgi:hypothetical protein
LEVEAARFTPGHLHSRVERIRVKGSEGAPAGVFEESFWRWLVERLGGMVEEGRSGTNQLGGKGLRVCCWLLAELVLIVEVLFPPQEKAHPAASQRKQLAFATTLVVVFVAVMFLRPWSAGERRWIRAAKKELDGLGQPPARFTQGSRREWATGPWLVFSNGWACFTCRTIHSQEDPRDIALLRASNGQYYLCHFHFEFGAGEYLQQEQPRNLEDFMGRYEQAQGWKRLST